MLLYVRRQQGRNLMVAVVLFWAGIGLGSFTTVVSFIGRNDNKTAVTAAPFFLLAGAAVAQYLGM